MTDKGVSRLVVVPAVAVVLAGCAAPTKIVSDERPEVGTARSAAGSIGRVETIERAPGPDNAATSWIASVRFGDRAEGSVVLVALPADVLVRDAGGDRVAPSRLTAGTWVHIWLKDQVLLSSPPQAFADSLRMQRR